MLKREFSVFITIRSSLPHEGNIIVGQLASAHESLFSGNEDQPLRLGFLGRLDLPIGVTLDLLKASCLKIVKDVPVGEESEVLPKSIDVHAI